jgi:hypothetical protein
MAGQGLAWLGAAWRGKAGVPTLKKEVIMTPKEAVIKLQTSPILSKVKITDIDVPFWSMVKFMVKLAIASIPAVIILWILAAFSVELFRRIVALLVF